MNAAKALTGLVAIGMFLAASGAAQAGPIGEFKIQRGEVDVTGTGVSITAGFDYEAPANLDNAFVRIVNTRLSGGGKSSGGGNQNSADWNVSISNPGDLLNSINFARYSNSNNTRVTWEIIEYVGALGGPNEFIVRAHDQIENTAQSATGAAVAGIADDAAVVPFITGQRVNADNRDNAHLTMHYSSWDDTTDAPTFTRGVSSATAAAISYAVVEFTGSNWDIDRAVYDFGTSTGNDQTVTIDPVDLGKTFIHAQNTATQTGLNDQGVDTRLTATDTVSYSVWTDTNQVGVAWIIENTEADPNKDMVVQHVEGTKPKGGGDGVAWTEPISGVWNLSGTSIMGESATSDGTGTAHPRGSINLELTAADEVTLWRSDDGQPNNYSFDVVEWPTAYILDLTWDGAGPGTWGDPSRWTPGPNTPDASEDAIIDTANTVTVAANQAANNLAVSNDGVVKIAATKRLDVTTELDAAGGSVVLDNSTLAVGGGGSIGTLTADGSATLTAGAGMTVGSAALNNSTLAIGGDGAITTLTADGNTTLSAGGSMAVASYSDNGTATALTLGGGAAFDLQTISTVAGSSFRVEGSSLQGPAVAKPLGDAQTLVLAGGTYTFADLVGAAASGAAPGGNVVAHWAFDDGTGTNAQNAANPGTNDGTLENFPVDDSQWVAGLIGTGALEFDGSDDQVSIVGYQGISGTGARTISGWIKASSTKNDADIMSWGTDSAGQKWIFRVQDDNGPVDGNIRVEVNGGYIVGETVVADDTWHHVAVVLPDGATQVQDIQLYVDGQPETPSATSNRAIDTVNSVDVIIGRETWNTGRSFMGTMDNLYLYDRALTAAEVAETYATHTPPDFSALQVTVDAGTATLASQCTSDTAFADLTMKQGGTLATTSLFGTGISFTGGTTIEAGATAVGFDPHAPTDLNAIDGSAAPNVVITKTGDGTLVLDDAGTDLAPTATINVEGGTVVGYHGSNPFDEATLKVSGGELILAAKPAATSPVTYDNAVVADADGTITAGAGSAGHAGPMTVNLGSAGNGVTINSGNTLTLRTTDDYTLNVAGSVAGGGLAVDQGTVNLAGASVDDLNVSGTGQVNLSTSINTTNLSVSNTSLHAGAHTVTVAETGVMTLGCSTYTATTGAFQVTGDVTRSVADTLILGGPGTVVTLGLTPFQGVSIGNDTNATFPTGGSLVVNGDTYTVTASGGDIWGTADGCYLAYLEFDASEAFDITALAGANGYVGGTNAWRKGGLMARDSLSADSRNALTLIADADANGINAQIRKDDNIGSIGCANSPGTSAYIGQRTAHDTPVYLRLVYHGDGVSFDYYWSEDPAVGWNLINDPAWDTEGKVTSPTLLDTAMTGTIYVGLAVTSHNTGEQTAIDFDNLAGFGFGEPTTVNNVTGEGTIAGDVLIAGSLAPGGSIGQIDVTGSLALDATATYNVEVDGTLIDLVSVTGDLALAGVLSIDGLLTEEEYTIMTYGGDLSGAFDDISDVIAQGLTVDYSLPGAVRITPEPASLALLAFGALGLLLRRRRK